MTEVELIRLIQQVQEQYAGLFGQIISINFAMVVAIWYFLHRARLAFRIAAFGFYLLGMLTFTGLMLLQANVKATAVAALRAIPPSQRSQFSNDLLALQDSWLFHLTSLFQNASLWVLIAVTGYLLFFWDGASKPTLESETASRSPRPATVPATPAPAARPAAGRGTTSQAGSRPAQCD